MSGIAMIPGGRGTNPKQMKMMMKRLGINVEEIDDVTEVVIRTPLREYTFYNPSVTAMVAQGQTTYQVVGEPVIVDSEGGVGAASAAPRPIEIPEEDIELVASQAGVSHEEARAALIECEGEPAEAILKLMSG